MLLQLAAGARMTSLLSARRGCGECSWSVAIVVLFLVAQAVVLLHKQTRKIQVGKGRLAKGPGCCRGPDVAKTTSIQDFSAGSTVGPKRGLTDRRRNTAIN